jgi:hypothetical protein
MEKAELYELGVEILGADNDSRFFIYLADGDIETAKTCLLGSLDALFEQEFITEDEAAAYYARLGYDPEKASRLRQNRTD